MGYKDHYDAHILIELQKDASLSVEALSERIGMPRNTCWRRLKQLEASGIIKARVAVLDGELAGCGLSVLIFIRTANHDTDWFEQLRKTVMPMPEVVGFYRTSGEIDYVLRARVSDVKAYDRLYQKLIKKVPLADVSASFIMEEVKDETAIPLGELSS
jgi:Lrp/AsnC family transcriptional regulator